ncbi:hypothetical protein HDE68_004978 [Pedobacter cryoconitis]|uniref:Methylamine utilisation protein MauE domain-containing protein n=1 Tax=Pedobacter cryoconitis TaxID=188932 RepID=A0A7W9E2P3_9SPHI|nr:MauE/DoxX family redox-associated membrane protein [Pedobacter cryoconitis]MBB5639040.1 hypothetical protein [Pedobacter cryoconitis]
MKKPLIVEIICGGLSLLFAYTAFSKLADFEDFKKQLKMQVFPQAIVEALLYLIPGIELSVVILMMIKGSRLIGLGLSVLLMALFTGYIALVLSNYYDHIPCSCGGVLKNLGWQTHLWFNTFFLILSMVGLMFQYQILRGGKMKK